MMDSPLNKAGLLQVYLTTAKKALIELSPQVRIPRTYKPFAALMAQLLTKLKVRAATGSKQLMSVIKNPVTEYLPLGCRIIGTSAQADLKSMDQYVEEFSTKNTAAEYKPICFVVGAVSIGNPGMENDYVTDTISISS